ncbi:MAG TPA: sigma-70 family RNA polymerase sigma factor [Anaerolineales bacterium]|nr:sigma-70 family RNA polymerase sigma factor [Anaerolineales bacterium]HRQ92894.1 sigma-70 family RNA polymerase sigma factor [Anaerolineales bacterium]
MQPDEQEWLRQAQEGDAQAFSQLVELYAKPVHNLCYRMLGNTQDAEDAAQEAFLRAFRAIGRYDPKRKFASWLLSIAANYCIDQHRRARLNTVSLEDSPEASLGDKAAGPAARLVQRETHDELQALLARLDPRDRAAIILYYWNELSYEEIAAQLSLSESALKSRLHRARRSLAQAWELSQQQPSATRSKTHEEATI